MGAASQEAAAAPTNALGRGGRQRRRAVAPTPPASGPTDRPTEPAPAVDRGNRRSRRAPRLRRSGDQPVGRPRRRGTGRAPAGTALGSSRLPTARGASSIGSAPPAARRHRAGNEVRRRGPAGGSGQVRAGLRGAAIARSRGTLAIAGRHGTTPGIHPPNL